MVMPVCGFERARGGDADGDRRARRRARRCSSRLARERLDGGRQQACPHPDREGSAHGDGLAPGRRLDHGGAEMRAAQVEREHGRARREGRVDSGH